MTNPVDPALASSLSAPASEVPAQQRQSEASSNPSQPQPQQQQTQPSKESGKPKKEKKEAKPKDTKDATPATDGPEKLTGAELKKRAKAEKAARRAKEKSDRETGGASAAPTGGPAAGGSGAGAGAGQPATPKKGQPAGGAGVGGDKGRGLPRRPSGQASGQPSAAEQKKKAEEKNVAVFGHLYGQQRRATVAGAGKEVHPAVLALGLQMRDYVVCGSSARCVATLLAFKRVRFSIFPGLVTAC